MDNADEIIRELKRVQRLTEQGAARGMYRIGQLVATTARFYAPISPTQGQLNQLRKAEWKLRGKKPSGAQKKAWKASKNPRATSRPKPGGLIRSIGMTSDAKNATIFVATNSEAGKYAYRIHEEKGKTWKNRGPGTVAKPAGLKADAKFISRAIADTRDKQLAILQNEIEKAIAKGNQ
jgi:hypothetical protein